MPLLKSLKNFRPRLGMGWFDSIGYITSNANNVFVPAWGWGGSRMIKSRHTAISKFSSPLGDGLVPMNWCGAYYLQKFSSPSGDGVVR